MQIYILNPEYEFVGMIDEAESVVWHKKYNDVGEAEIYIPCTETHLELLQKNNYLYRYDDDMFCKIETVEVETDVENGDYIIATAADICKIISDRIVWDNFTFSGTVGEFIKKVLTDNVINSNLQSRNIANLMIDENSIASITDETTYTTASDDILQLVITTCKTYNCGFRLAYNTNTQSLVFRLYKGANKATVQSDEYVEFSPQFANIVSSKYKQSASNYKNFAIVGAKDTDESIMYITVWSGVSEPQGEARKEIYVDATNASREITVEELLQIFPTATLAGSAYTIKNSGEVITVATVNGDKVTVTDYTYQQMLEIIGFNALAERTETQEFTGEVDTINSYEYKVDYDLGDTVYAVNEYDVGAPAQITEVWETEDNENGYQIEPTFEYIN